MSLFMYACIGPALRGSAWRRSSVRNARSSAFDSVCDFFTLRIRPDTPHVYPTRLEIGLAIHDALAEKDPE